MVQLEERLETTIYHEYGRKPISNEVVEGTLHHKVCLVFNYIVIGGIVFVSRY
jgi:hypothetical protein